METVQVGDFLKLNRRHIEQQHALHESEIDFADCSVISLGNLPAILLVL